MGDYYRTMIESDVDLNTPLPNPDPKDIKIRIQARFLQKRLAQAWGIVEKNKNLKNTFLTRDSLASHLLGVGLAEFLDSNKG